ncbi:indole-3-glycerol phosphate synthase [Helicobacter typhlonius]|uniref:indole-3-glycerol phosphate synthase n=2 Tax=Helicobacter typhlonius TaxID=76936 RepID=UPI002FE4160B
MMKQNAAQSHITKEQIQNAKVMIHARKSVIDFDTLGRTLAYSPYLSRFEVEAFTRKGDDKPKIAKRFSIQAHFDEVLFLQEASDYAQSKDNDAFLLDLRAQYEKIQSSENGLDTALESISLLRRHSTLPIIHADIFLEPYQILESALFGADNVLIPCAIHSKDSLSDLLHFARKLGFEPCIEVSDKSELKKAIFSGASMLYIPQNALDELLSLVPNTQMIMSDHSSDYGVDIVIIN